MAAEKGEGTGGGTYCLRGSTHVTDYNKARLVYVERHDEILPAITREKLVKKWKREWKFALIEAENPDWLDLWDEWFPDTECKK